MHKPQAQRLPQLATVVIAVVLVSVAQSQPPPPGPAKAASQPKSNAPASQANADGDKRATLARPAIVEILKAPVIQVEAADKTEKARDYADHEWWLVYLTAALTGVTCALAFYTARLYDSTKKIAGDTEKAATNSVQMTRAIERAYVKISPTKPGIRFFESKPGSVVEGFSCGFEIQNFGQTPATISDVVVTFGIISVSEQIPSEPAYIRAEQNFGGAFLVRDDKFFTTRQKADMKGKLINTIQNGVDRLFVFGYVDYEDAFGVAYRGGFGRLFRHDLDMRTTYDSDEAFADRSNLLFMDETGYNYDRTLHPGEGKQPRKQN